MKQLLFFNMKKIYIFALLVGMLGCSTANYEALVHENDAVTKRGLHPSKFFTKIPAEEPKDFQSMEGQVYMQMLPAVGREDLQVKVSGYRRVAGPCQPSSNTQSDILATIADLAKSTRIVIINEAHDQPRHRYFISQVAETLSEIGFSVYAAETFSSIISNTENHAYGLITDGYYSNEPVFGELIRRTRSLGYKLVAYESTFDWSDESMTQSEKVARREEEQANNLIEQLSRFEDDTKIFVHAGYSHASEVPIPSFGGTISWMAARVKQKTGIDPLTIDQTICQSSSDSFGFFGNKQRIEPGQFDLVVGHPDLSFNRNRPQWRVDLGQRLVDIPESLRSDSDRFIIEARMIGEPLLAIPVDRVMLWPGEDVALLLAPGKYKLTAYTEGKDSLKAALLTIE